MDDTAGKTLHEGEPPLDELFRLVGRRVREARSAEGLTRKALSERSGVSPRYLAKLEGGDGNISIGLLKRVACALGRSMDSFVADDDRLVEEVAHIAALYRQADAATRAQTLRVLDPERLRAQKAERICLVGLRGAGKSTLGALVGADLGIPFVELSEEVEKGVGMPVAEIIALYGQDGYRQIEADTLAQITDSADRMLLAVAGGIVDEPETFDRLLARFHTIWIKASPSEHMERVRAQGDVRPMAGNPRAMLQLREILKAREALYRQAEQHLDTSGKTLETSRAELRTLIEEQGILTAAAGSGPDDEGEQG